jgi:spore maturation protein CgeB
MRILVAGDWHSDLHEQEVMRSLVRLGHTVGEFKWHHYFSFEPGARTSLRSLLKRAQNKYVVGPAVRQINKDFVSSALRFRPDAVFVYRGTHINSDSLQAIKAAMPHCVLVGYNNDDPFAPSQPKYLWRHFIAATPYYDLMLAYRHANMELLRSAGAKNVELLRSWYVADRNFAVELSQADEPQFSTDVVFVGHYEPDQRLEYLEEIVRQGFSLRIFGPTKYWNKPLEGSTVLRHLAPTRMVWGADYNKALCGAKVALCFLSKLNRDTYTRRCFEIPATQTLMLSEYSEDLTSLYAEGLEADYFRNKDELMEKIQIYVNDDVKRSCVAQAGYRKLIGTGHDVDSRMISMLRWVDEIRNTGATA